MKKIILLIVVALAILAVVIAMQPADYAVARSTDIAAPPEIIFPHLNDLRAWEQWSPWAKLDPNATAAFSGPDAGVGAVMGWDGNNEVGAGQMTITESRPNEFVELRLDFTRPFEDTGMSSFILESEGESTRVTWTMTGKNNFMGKAFSLFCDMDSMIGDKYDEGLAKLKTISEARIATP